MAAASCGPAPGTEVISALRMASIGSAMISLSDIAVKSLDTSLQSRDGALDV